MILLCLLPVTKANDCAHQNIAWTGYDVKAIDNCDILKDQVTVHLDQLTTKRNCLTQVVVELTGPQKLGIQGYGKVDLGTPATGNQRTTTFINPLAQEYRCSSTSVSLTTWVFSSGRPRAYSTSFSLYPWTCTKESDGIDFKEHCSDVNPTTTSKDDPTDGGVPGVNDETTPILLGAGIGGGLLVLLLIIVVAMALWKKRTTQKIKNDIVHTDENHVYGTYSRGSLEDGEYGDGDVVEIIDTNLYYEQ